MWFFSKKNQKERNRTVAPEYNISSTLLSYQIANLQGIGMRENQEDSFGFANVLDVTQIRDKGLLAVVADGMGGMEGGKTASDMAVNCIRAEFENLDYDSDIALQLKNCVEKANEKIHETLNGRGGTTVIACVFYKGKLYYVSVGDSYLYLKREGQLYHLNRKHNVMNDEYLSLVKNGCMDSSIARENPEKDALTLFLGMEFVDESDYFRRPLSLESGDVVLICSDGVGGVLDDSTILSCLSRTTSQDMCEELENCILEKKRPHQDNYTALVIQCL
ncbi:MAG: PP2C family protein-serine/threonine phosphatase [Ruminococcus sp.]